MNSMLHPFSNFLKSRQPLAPRILLLSLLTAVFFVGLSVAKDYGMSWDELGLYSYAERILPAYARILRPWEYEGFQSELRLHLYGPFHFMASTLVARLVVFFDSSWTDYEAHHLAYFITFLCALPALYFLCARWMSEWAALATTALVVSQPLMWGNAFINPKDMPFMALFIVSLYFGLAMTDDDSPAGRWKIFAAGIALGITTSTRIVGPIAGGIVLLYGLWKNPRRTVRLAPPYLLSAAAAVYLTWPYLWSAPLSRFWESLQAMSKYPMRASSLFAGELYPSEQMPVAYFPTLAALQLTESLLLLAVLGAALSVRAFFQKDGNKEPLALFFFGFLAPFLAIALRGSTLYDNARQLLFLLYPIFIFAGIGLDALLKKIKIPALQAVLILAALAPGGFACVRLHPYQYVYYNQIIGGVDGAFRKFDLDYAGTSFKEAMRYINAHSEPHVQTFALTGPRHLARVYARKSLKENLLGEFDSPNPQGADYYYVLLLTRANADVGVCSEGEIVYSIERDGGVLAYIRKVRSKTPCW